MSEQFLFPTIDVPDLVSEVEEVEERGSISVQWDVSKGDFATDGANRLLECDEQEAFKTWCYKIAMTERYACLSYPDTIGVEMEEALEEPSNDAVESAIERTITEALMVNPRTEYVRDFEIRWDGSNVFCSFTIKGTDWEEEQLTIKIEQETK